MIRRTIPTIFAALVLISVSTLGAAFVTAVSAGADGTQSLYSGFLFDSSGSPVTGALFELETSGAAPQVFSTNTSSDGSFSISVASGQYILNIVPAEPAFNSSVISTTLNLVSSVTGVTLTIPAFEQMSEVVSDSSGNPIAGATVFVQQNIVDCTTPIELSPGVEATDVSELSSNVAVTTNASGTASFEVLPCASSPFLLDEVSAPGYINNDSIFEPQTSDDIAISLESDSSASPGMVEFSGVLMNTSGVPLAEGEIQLKSSNNQYFNVPTAYDGGFTLFAPAGTYTLNVEPPNAQFFETEATTSINLASSLTSVVLTTPAFEPIIVVAADASGDPIPGANLSISGGGVTRLLNSLPIWQQRIPRDLDPL